jgi:NSS family neurotransmitter:Na+ symporter
MLIALFAGWSLDRLTARDELGVVDGPWFAYWHFALRFLVPVAFGLIMLDVWI